MATYAIGDVQGCHETLMRLVARIGFDASRDQLWFVGDLVNRGPKNVEVLRFVRGLGDRAIVVLGNHDLHLLGRASGLSPAKKRDTIEDVLAAPDRDALVGWLRARPLVHREGGHLLVHAGLLPSWTVDEAEARAREVEAMLQAPPDEDMSGDPDRITKSLQVFTRLRTCRDDETLCDFDGELSEVPKGCTPWFSSPRRRSRDVTIVFGHWSALGLYVGADCLGLDTGCVWGRSLTAMRLEDRQVFSEPAAER